MADKIITRKRETMNLNQEIKISKELILVKLESEDNFNITGLSTAIATMESIKSDLVDRYIDLIGRIEE